jgi:hypothetical protein
VLDEAFPSNVSDLSTAIDGYRLAIYINLEFAGTAIAADPDVRNRGHSVTLVAKAVRVMGQLSKYQRVS